MRHLLELRRDRRQDLRSRCGPQGLSEEVLGELPPHDNDLFRPYFTYRKGLNDLFRPYLSYRKALYPYIKLFNKGLRPHKPITKLDTNGLNSYFRGALFPDDARHYRVDVLEVETYSMFRLLSACPIYCMHLNVDKHQYNICLWSLLALALYHALVTVSIEVCGLPYSRRRGFFRL